MSAGTDLVVQAIGLFISFAVAWYTALNHRKIRLLQIRKFLRIIPIIKEGRWLIATGFTVYIYTSLELPLLGWLHSLKEVGIYRTSIVLVSGFAAFTGYLPMLLYPRMLEWNQVGPHNLWFRQKKVLTYFTIFSVCLSLLAFAFAPLGYHYIYGPAFQRGAYPFAFLLAAKLIAVMNGILGWGMVAQRRDRNLFHNMAYVAVFSLVGNLVFIPQFGAYAASIVNLLSEILMVTLNITSIQRYLKTLEPDPVPAS
jgi:O-antigen/teichoic acid export membrane protein